MKRIVYMWAIIFCINIGYVPNVVAQQTLQEAYKQGNVAWLGLDFGLAKMVGPDGFRDPHRIVNVYLNAWNDMFLTERNKYDVDKALKLVFTTFRPDFFRDKNLSIAHTELVGYNVRPALTKTQLQNAVSSYNTSALKEKVAVAIIVDELNSINKNGTAYLVMLDTQTKTIIYKHRLYGKPSGVSFRNYWAGAYHDWIKVLRKKAWPEIRQQVKN